MLDTILKQLNIDPLALLLNIVLFVVLLIVLNAIFWKPMMKHLDRRKKEITDAYKSVDDTRREMERLKAEYQQRLAGIEAEARGHIQHTVREAQESREKLIEEAHARVETAFAQGVVSIEQEKIQTLSSMRESLDTVAAHALGKATGSDVDQVQKSLIDEFIRNEALRS